MGVIVMFLNHLAMLPGRRLEVPLELALVYLSLLSSFSPCLAFYLYFCTADPLGN